MAGSRLGLGNLVSVMDINMIDTAAMDVQLFAQIFQAHGRTFNVPAGKTDAPRAIPLHLTTRSGVTLSGVEGSGLP